MSSAKRIIIVEDDLSLEPFWTVLLNRCFKEWTMDWVISSEEARRLIANSNEEGNPYHLAIVDIFLSGGETGLDLLNANELFTAETKTILVTSTEEDKVRTNFADVVKNGEVLTKPLNYPKCERVITRLFPEAIKDLPTDRQKNAAKGIINELRNNIKL